MSTQLVVLNISPLQRCHRCGDCCNYILIGQSPKELLRRYLADERFASETEADIPQIREIYPMLRGRCRGSFAGRYVYGPCANLYYEDGLAGCRLHGSPRKPSLCSGYPFYLDQAYELDKSQIRNPGYMRGCGYNLDADVRLSEAEILVGLEPLDPSEAEPIELCLLSKINKPIPLLDNSTPSAS